MDDHEGLHARIDKIGKMVEELKEGSSIGALADEMQEYERVMLPHLEEEEVECLPLMRAYFTPKEIAVILQEIIKKGTKVSETIATSTIF